MSDYTTHQKERSYMLPIDSKERKKFPVHTGCLAYFPQALALVARVSYDGNEKHAFGQPLQWVRGKSNDQEDCLARHTLDSILSARRIAGGASAPDYTYVYEKAQVAWRALAALELAIEAAGGLVVMFPGEGGDK